MISEFNDIYVLSAGINITEIRLFISAALKISYVRFQAFSIPRFQ